MIWRNNTKREDQSDPVATKSRLISQFHFDAAREALRACFLANGAALLALLSYLGSISKGGEQIVLPTPMAISTLAFGAGLACSVLAHLLMWQHQEDVDYGRRWTIQNRHIRCILFGSWLFLLAGVIAASVATAFPIKP